MPDKLGPYKLAGGLWLETVLDNHASLELNGLTVDSMSFAVPIVAAGASLADTTICSAYHLISGRVYVRNFSTAAGAWENEPELVATLTPPPYPGVGAVRLTNGRTRVAVAYSSRVSIHEKVNGAWVVVNTTAPHQPEFTLCDYLPGPDASSCLYFYNQGWTGWGEADFGAYIMDAQGVMSNEIGNVLFSDLVGYSSRVASWPMANGQTAYASVGVKKNETDLGLLEVFSDGSARPTYAWTHVGINDRAPLLSDPRATMAVLGKEGTLSVFFIAKDDRRIYRCRRVGATWQAPVPVSSGPVQRLSVQSGAISYDGTITEEIAV